MKRAVPVFLVAIYCLSSSSCSTDETELSSSRHVENKNDFSDAILLRDSLSRDENGIDPPSKPVIVGTRPSLI